MSANLQIGGLASGINTQEIITKILESYRRPVERLNQNKQLLEWKQTDYREINGLLLSFSTGSALALKLESTFKAKTTVSGNEQAVSATAGAQAANGTYMIKVDALAAIATNISTGAISSDPGNKIDPALSLASQKEKFAAYPAHPEYFTGSFSFNLTTAGSDGQPVTKSFTINPNNDSLNIILNRINNSLPLTAFYDSSADKVSLATTKTGDYLSGQEIQFAGDGFLAQVLNLSQANEQGGTDGQATINGLDVQVKNNSYTAGYVTFNFKNTTAAPVTVTVGPDTDKVVESVKTFVEDYNALLEKINGETRERYNRNYPPLTEEQKKQMTEEEIKKWEVNSRNGLLANDLLLEKVVSDLRTALTSSVNGLSGSFNHLSQVGITTGNWNEYGKLYFNENQFRAALAADQESVTALFTNNSDNYAQEGVGERLYTAANQAISRLVVQAGAANQTLTMDTSNLGQQIYFLNQRIFRLEERLAVKEEQLWRQFAAMEELVNMYNNQSNWLAQQVVNMQNQTGQGSR
jgi:flagellar hook-associated protein 2